MMPGPTKQYEFFIVVLTRQGKLIDAHVRATSISNAMDKFIDEFGLAGNIVEFKFCTRREL